ncbi:hypothetical protein SAKOR_01377 [Staphylococcus aureus subsp. aureus CN1]|nr:hypothetical protein SAKOR_01377 [Staphylococcus aureus subsp. aureus CN1]BAR08894.1 hypothetical protein SAJPND1_01383 [Staphylococcus aureus]BAR11618.1 hypothetical protein SAJPND4_01383 [Staphylococcus aureus]
MAFIPTGLLIVGGMSSGKIVTALLILDATTLL